MTQPTPTEVKVAEAIAGVFAVVAGLFLAVMMVWGFIHRPLGTFLFILFTGGLFAIVWALLTLTEWDGRAR